MGSAPDGNSGGAQRSALNQRVLTALALGPLLIGTILYPAFPPFAAVLALFLAVAAWEWAGLAGVRGRVYRAIYIGAVVSGGGLLLFTLNTDERRLVLAAGASLLWVALTALIARVQRGAELPHWARPMILALGGLVLLPFWLCICWLKLLDFRLVLALVMLIWLADTLAYFGGKRWGKRRLAPRLSPGKTWEGVAAAALAAPMVGGLLAFQAGELHARSVVALSALCLAVVAVSIVGDLFESLLKRRASVKDSGTLLPGHGGVLDRIDSLTAAAPIFYLGVTVLVGHP